MITVKVTASGFKDAFTAIDKYLDENALKKKGEELCKRLADIGEQEAFTGFMAATANGEQDPVQVHSEPIENGYKIVAEGEEVCFIEFGAGVHYNGAEPYPLPRPEGIVGIGQYGKGLGRNDYWFYSDESGSHFTHGTPAAMPMYNATKEILESIPQIANEVFND